VDLVAGDDREALVEDSRFLVGVDPRTTMRKGTPLEAISEIERALTVRGAFTPRCFAESSRGMSSCEGLRSNA
jgi:hypothetical protein